MADRILVTGGCGFIGSHLTERLLEQGWRVRVLDNLVSGSLENLHAVRPDVDFVHGDIRDPEVVARATREVSVVFHQAAMVSVNASVQAPVKNHHINATGTLNVLQAAREADALRVITASSAAVYGHNQNLPLDETAATCPLSPYAAAKLTGEYYTRLYAELYELETVALRYFNVYGPRQDPSSMYSGVISKFAERIARGLAPCIYGDGFQSRDFVYVDDVVQANLAAMDSTMVGAGETLNVGTGTCTTIGGLLSTMGSVADTHLNAEYHEARAGDVRHSQADITRAARLLEYSARYTLEDGLRALLETGERTGR